MELGLREASEGDLEVHRRHQVHIGSITIAEGTLSDRKAEAQFNDAILSP